MDSPHLWLLAGCVLGFFFGALPAGLWVARFRGIDIRKVGSGNIGFTNVWRCVGRKEGGLVLVADILKGALPTALLPLWLPEGDGLLRLDVAALLIGVAAILGHCFTPFAGFRGGKGVATSLGVFLVLAWLPLLITLALWIAIVAATRYISLGSVCAAVALPVLIAFLQSPRIPLFWAAAMIGLLVLVKHRSNMVRLVKGQESRFSLSSQKTSPTP